MCATRPDCANCEQLGYPGHPFVAHHGEGPCIAVISTALKATKQPEGRAGYGSVCPCQKYAEKP